MSIQVISNTFFEGERPLFAKSDLRLEKVKFYPGESALKHCHRVQAIDCEFMGKYPLWHDDGVELERCRFTVYSRAAIWYSERVRMVNSVVEAPKMFREVRHLSIEDTDLSSASECGWNCHDVELRSVEIRGGDYLLMNGSGIRIEGFRLQGNYAFQGARDVVIRDAKLDSKDAFWNAENVTVHDSVLDGEYLGWHSRNLRLVNCTIRGSQPLCYATDLVLENCVMVDTDLCFEHSTLDAVVNGEIRSIKNPRGGSIKAGRIGEIVLDQNCAAPGTCEIVVGWRAAA